MTRSAQNALSAKRIAEACDVLWEEPMNETEIEFNDRVLAAIAAARREQHAKCVRLLEERGKKEDNCHWSNIAAYWLELREP